MNFPTKPSDFSIEEARRFLSCARSTIYSLLKSGQLQSYRIGRTVRITSESIERLRSGVASDD